VKKERLYQIDALKGICCFIICFMQHYDWLLTDGFGMPFPLHGRFFELLYKYGYYCVETFFTISGFMMAYNYRDRLRESIAKCNTSLFAFLWGRVRKIYPLLVLTLITTTVLQFPFRLLTGRWFYVEDVNLYSFLMSLFSISSGWFVVDVNLNIPVWFFSVLILCYCVYYLILKFSKGNEDSYRIFSALFVLLGISAFLVPIWKPFLYENTIRGYYCYFLGVLMFEIYDGLKKNKGDTCISISANVCLALLLIISALCALFGGEAVLGIPQLIWGAILSPMIIWVFINQKLVMKTTKAAPIPGGGGTSVYFWHFTCYQIIRIIAEIVNITPYYSSLWFYLVVVIFISVVSIFSFYIIEPRLLSVFHITCSNKFKE